MSKFFTLLFGTLVIAGCGDFITPTGEDFDSSRLITNQKNRNQDQDQRQNPPANENKDEVDPFKPLDRSLGCENEKVTLNGAHPCIRFTGRALKQESGGMEFDWPGVYFEFKFKGERLSLNFTSSATNGNVYFDIYVNGIKFFINGDPSDKFASLVVGPGNSNFLIATKLDQSIEQVVKVVKRSETNFSTVTLNEVNIGEDGHFLDPNFNRDFQIEFIGDSYTAGYGIESVQKNEAGEFLEVQNKFGRSCGGGKVSFFSNADKTYAATASRELNADYQINAYSGLGLVRNFGGREDFLLHKEYYKRALQSKEKSPSYEDESWKPKYVVVALGVNDFSKSLTEKEKNSNFPTKNILEVKYRNAYKKLVKEILKKHPETHIIAMASELEFFIEKDMINNVGQVVNELKSEGVKIDLFRFNINFEEVIDGQKKVVTRDFGCDFHPDKKANLSNASDLVDLIKSLP